MPDPVMAYIAEQGWCIRRGLNTAFVVGRQGALDAEFKGCGTIQEAADIVRAASALDLGPSRKTISKRRLHVVLELPPGEMDSTARRGVACAACTAAIEFAGGSDRGAIEDDEGTVIARFWIADT